jgi:small GTP-binding protein
MEEESSLKGKIILIGNANVGKTSIFNYKISRDFQEKYKSTIGANYQKVKIEVDSKKIILYVWDTAGQDNYRNLVPYYFRDTQAVLIVFSVT